MARRVLTPVTALLFQLHTISARVPLGIPVTTVRLTRMSADHPHVRTQLPAPKGTTCTLALVHLVSQEPTADMTVTNVNHHRV